MMVYLVCCASISDPIHAAFSTMELAKGFLDKPENHCNHGMWIFSCQIDGEV